MKVFSSYDVVTLEDLKKGRAKQIAVAEPAIEISFEELHSILNERKKQLVQETLKRVEEKIQKLSVQEKKLSLASEEVQSIIDYTKRFVGHCSDNEVMSLPADIKR